MLNFNEIGLKDELIAKVDALVLPAKADPSLAPQLEHCKTFLKAEIGFAKGRGLHVVAKCNPNSPLLRQLTVSINTTLP